MQEETQAEDAPNGARDRVTVVVADRHAFYAEGVAALARRTEDITVLGTACSVEELLYLVSTLQPSVVLIDLHLPEEGGLSVARRVRRELPDVSILLLAGNSLDGISSALAAGVHGMITKSCDAQELFAAIRTVAVGDAVLPAAAAWDLARPGNNVLTPSEIDLLSRFVSGVPQADLARELLMSESTFKRKFLDVQRKLGATNRLDAIARAARMGLI